MDTVSLRDRVIAIAEEKMADQLAQWFIAEDFEIAKEGLKRRHEILKEINDTFAELPN
jgi:hypothetical protein